MALWELTGKHDLAEIFWQHSLSHKLVALEWQKLQFLIVQLHNYREAMILGRTYTWGKTFFKRGICKPKHQIK